MSNKKITAFVKWYSPKKGFGFLKRPFEDDVMIHAATLKQADFPKPLYEDDVVECEIAERPDGKVYACRVLTVNGETDGLIDRTTVEAIAERFEARAAVDAVKRAFWIEAAAICREGVAR